MSAYLEASTPPESQNSRATQNKEAMNRIAANNADYRTVDREKLTPMMQHFVEMKERYPQALLLYRDASINPRHIVR
jgi:DNA mismatch repair protein MutS